MSQVVLEIHNLKTLVHGKPEVANLLFANMALFNSKARFSPAFKNGVWDGKVRFYNRRNNSLDTGMLSWASRILQDNGYHVRYRDKRQVPKPRFAEISLAIELRDYQQDVVRQCVRCSRGIVNAATGAGKTEIFIALIAALRVPSIVIVDNVDLATQTADRIRGLDIPVRKMTGGKIHDYGHQPWVSVSTYQTLHRRKNWLKKAHYDLKIADECHGVAAKTWFSVMSAIPAYYSFGFSGSIDWQWEDAIRYAQIMGMTGKQIVNIPSDLLVKMGFLAKPNIIMVEYEREWQGGSYFEEYEAIIVKDEKLNKEIVPKIAARHLQDKVLILVNRLDHGRMLAEELGFPWVCGDDTAEYRENMLNDFRDGKINKLIASKIFKQGIDIPDVEVMITVGSDDSYHSVFQKLGRGMRKTATKDSLHYYDIFPRTHGYLEKHAKNRLKKYESMGFDVEIIKDIM